MAVRMQSPPMPLVDGSTGRRRAWLRSSGVLAIYFFLASAYTWPLVIQSATRFGGDAGDPSLVASVLWRNATMLPFSTEWWNAPHYYPSEGVSAFTENFMGVSPIASPVAWLSRNPLLTYNVAFLATWVVSAFTTYLLVVFLTKRKDAAFLAGLAFAFTPYRIANLSHLHTLSAYWMPLCLLALHGFLEHRRRGWLWLFGVTWLLQSLANGHYMLFGGVLIAMWLAYFCSTRGAWRAGATLTAVWIAASLPLAPIMNTYRLVHAQYGLTRSLNEIMAFSATPASWAQASHAVWIWGAVFPEGSANLFPGLTMVLLAMGGLGRVLLRRRPDADPPAALRWVRAGLGVVIVVCIVGIAISLHAGRWSTTVAGIVVRMGSLDRSLLLLIACGLPLVWLTPRTREALRRRSPFVFYTAMVLVVAVFCCGPVLRAGGEVILSPAPYAWLMTLPGFHELRVPTRFWMLGTLCLSISAGLAFVHLRPSRAAAGMALFSLAAFGVALDAWIPRMPMEDPPETWTSVEPPNRPEPILELPFGDHDYAATYRTTSHGRRIFNGVSGYNPPHYMALGDGLARRDPATLVGLSSLGPFDIVVDRESDPDGAIMRYASGAPGAMRIADDGKRAAYRIPKGPPEAEMGEPIPIVQARTSTYPEQAPLVFDGKLETGWGDYPQVPGQWVLLDLGAVREVGGLTHAIGDYLLDFPKRLAIDLSSDGTTWERVWEGPSAAATVLAYIRAPREGALRFTFDPHPARYVRLEQLESHKSMWRVSEIRVHAPRSPIPKP